jgi:UDP-glucose 4-epimerase
MQQTASGSALDAPGKADFEGQALAEILVVGGGGYIGSHTCLDLARKGHTPIVFDNFSNGHRDFVRWGPLEEGDIRDGARLDAVFRRHRPKAVIHFAALIEVGRSIAEPLAFFDNNVAGSISLFRAAARNGCRNVVFSSTCATYGVPRETPIGETHPQSPINPYGRSKLVVEEILGDICVHEGFGAVMLRYFNAAGAADGEGIGEAHDPETHALPLAIAAALGETPGFHIFGTDYDTRDGTCIRDFVHVLDLADAHTRAVEYLLAGGKPVAINLGTGTGTSVSELLDAVRRMSGRELPAETGPRRAGDSPILVADNRRAAEILGWRPRHDLDAIVASAWNWHSRVGVLPRAGRRQAS